jgi:hypothetical protein
VGKYISDYHIWILREILYKRLSINLEIVGKYISWKLWENTGIGLSLKLETMGKHIRLYLKPEAVGNI